MPTVAIEVRPARPGDAPALAEAHAEAWRGAYRGIIPAVTLERMVSRRGEPYWRAVTTRTPKAVLVLVFDGAVAGYAMIGRSRSGPSTRFGEIYEIYLKPPYQGVGLGRRLFEEARRSLEAAGLRGLVVWALAENGPACAFYRAMKGRRSAEHAERLGGASLVKVAFLWPPR